MQTIMKLVAELEKQRSELLSTVSARDAAEAGRRSAEGRLSVLESQLQSLQMRPGATIRTHHVLSL